MNMHTPTHTRPRKVWLGNGVSSTHTLTCFGVSALAIGVLCHPTCMQVSSEKEKVGIQIDAWTSESMNEWINVVTDEWMTEHMDHFTNEPPNERTD